MMCAKCGAAACCTGALPNEPSRCIRCLMDEVRDLRAVLAAGAVEAIATRVAAKLLPPAWVGGPR